MVQDLSNLLAASLRLALWSDDPTYASENTLVREMRLTQGHHRRKTDHDLRLCGLPYLQTTSRSSPLVAVCPIDPLETLASCNSPE